MRALIVEPTGGRVIDSDIDGSLEGMQAIVGGLIEVIDRDSYTLVFNEEGKRFMLGPNPVATVLAWPEHARNEDFPDVIVGNCIVLGPGVDDDESFVPASAFQYDIVSLLLAMGGLGPIVREGSA